MYMHNSVCVAALAALAGLLVVSWPGAQAAERPADGAAATPPLTLAAGSKGSGRASAGVTSSASSRASSSASASSRARSGGKGGGCEVETETRAEVRQGDRRRVDQHRDRQVRKGEDCAVSSESRSRAELGAGYEKEGDNSRK